MPAHRRHPLWPGLALAAVLALPATAQIALFDEAALVRACAAESCAPALAGILDRLQRSGLPQADLDTQIGFLAAVLLQSAESAEPARLPQIAQALTVLGQGAGDPRQAAAIREAAAATALGQAGDIAASGPYAASPSRPFSPGNTLPPQAQPGLARAGNGIPSFVFERRPDTSRAAQPGTGAP